MVDLLLEQINQMLEAKILRFSTFTGSEVGRDLPHLHRLQAAQ